MRVKGFAFRHCIADAACVAVAGSRGIVGARAGQARGGVTGVDAL